MLLEKIKENFYMTWALGDFQRMIINFEVWK